MRLGSSLVMEWCVTAVAKSGFGCAHSKEPRVKVFVSGWEGVDRNQESQEFNKGILFTVKVTENSVGINR